MSTFTDQNLYDRGQKSVSELQKDGRAKNIYPVHPGIDHVRLWLGHIHPLGGTSCPKWGRKEMFYLTTHSTHFIYGYMASDIWLRTILIVRKETRCRHIGYSFRLAARILVYAPSHRQDSTYHDLCYTSCGALAGTRNSSMGPPHERSIRRPIAPWANALTRELHLAPCPKWIQQNGRFPIHERTTKITSNVKNNNNETKIKTWKCVLHIRNLSYARKTVYC